MPDVCRDRGVDYYDREARGQIDKAITSKLVLRYDENERVLYKAVGALATVQVVTSAQILKDIVVEMPPRVARRRSRTRTVDLLRGAETKQARANRR